MAHALSNFSIFWLHSLKQELRAMYGNLQAGVCCYEKFKTKQFKSPIEAYVPLILSQHTHFAFVVGLSVWMVILSLGEGDVYL